jgi:hypothetical protein
MYGTNPASLKHATNTSNESQKAEQQNAIRNQLNRLLPTTVSSGEPDNNLSANVNKCKVITKVVIRPNPFFTAITLDVASEVSRHTIVRMYNGEGRIVKMFSWFLVKGTNVTSINEVNSLSEGTYHLDMIDNEGNLLYSTNLTKAVK